MSEFDEREASQRKLSDYRVGYGKPPPEHQFKPLHSGNPSGRPKRPKSFVELVGEAHSQKFPVMKKGKKVMMTRRQITAEQLSAQAASGDLHAIREIAKYDPYFQPQAGSRNLDIWFTLDLDEGDPGPHWQLIEDGIVIDEG